MVEQAMQAVDPSVSMPYWDYTLDKWLYTDRAPNGQHKSHGSRDLLRLWESPVWTADFFGASDEDTGVIVDGAWAHTKVPLLSERLFNDSGFAGHFRTNGFASCYGQTDDVCTYPALSLLRQKKASTMHQGNAFGLLRSPWNQRGEPTQGMYTSFADYMIQLQVSPHGTVHVFAGGAFGDCSAKYDELGKIVIDHHYLDQIKDKSSDLQKNLRSAAAAATASALQAGYDNSTLNAQDIADSKLWKQVVAGAFDGFREADRARAKLDLLGAPEKLRLLRTVCDVDVLTGDMLGSNSPMDVAFFATHTEVERMWQRFALSGNMTNSTWPYGPDSGTCPGQHPSYKLVWFDYELDSDDVGDDLEATLDSSTLSNVVWRDLLDPANPEYAVRVPYVYHDFEWEHCLHYSVEGVDASLMRPNDWIWNKRDDREESRGAIPNARAHSDLGNVTRVQPNSHSPRPSPTTTIRKPTSAYRAAAAGARARSAATPGGRRAAAARAPRRRGAST
ncbi:phosphatase [Aureococcus anophagefferens]|nr:phosphatase [Aureococcus anophagefferens]